MLDLPCSADATPAPTAVSVVATFLVFQVSMTPAQQQLYRAAVQKVRDEVMAAVEAASAPNSGYTSAQAAGRNARARNLNTKYFTSNNEASMAPIPLAKRKRGRPAKKKPGEEPAIGIMDGLGLENLGMSSGTPADSAGMSCS